MVGQDADRGDSRVQRTAMRRSAWGADRHDLEISSLANWSRALDDDQRELLAGVGHELKTPLAIVLALCGRLRASEELDPRQAQDVERIRANAYVLLKSVDELLQVSRIDGGHLVLEPRDVDVARLVRSSCEGFASVAELRGQRLVVEAPVELRALVDEEKLLSVVSNLLANALRHAPPAGVVRCTVAAPGEQLRIEVADSGPGVPAGLRQDIFERYRRGAANARGAGGTGLGLTIVRDLVALHHGRVTLADAPEGGALFVIELPLASPDAALASTWTIDVAERQRATVERLRADLDGDGRRHAPRPSDALERPSVLVVTSHAQLGAFLQDLVGTRYDLRHADDPLEAARLINAQRPDAVLLDAAAGSSAMAALGRRLGEAPVLTLAASPDDVPALLRAGWHDCVVKPFDPDELEARLEALVARGRKAAERAADLFGLDRAFRTAPVPMALIAADGRLLRVNRALSGLLGLRTGDLLARSIQDLTHPDDLRHEERRDANAPGRSVALDGRTRRLARADGSYVRVSAATSLIDDGESEGRVLWHLSDASSQRSQSADSAVLAGPPGRRAFERAVRHQLLRCRRYGEQAALVRCSLQSLPQVRSAHGPEVAHALVTSILEAVRRRLRSTDVLAYVGDHEIAALLAHADLDAANTTADAIREAAQSQRISAAGAPVGTAAEVGVASLARAGSPGQAFVDAGLAMQATDDGATRLRRFRRIDADRPGDVQLGPS
jgi:PAS domain S-box-containing protein/diguanylate cyclase (GGDEF)-like protein